MKKKWRRGLGCSTDHPALTSWPGVLWTASLLPLEPTLKRNQPLCLACKCLTINQHHKTHWLDALSSSPATSSRSLPLLVPSSFYSLSSSVVVDTGHMPQCHSPFLFPICPSALWQPSITRWRHGDRAPWGVFVRPSVNTAGLYEHCQLTEQHSPPPQLDKS